MGDTFPDGRWSWRPPITGQQTVANNLSGAKLRRQRSTGLPPSLYISRFEIRPIAARPETSEERGRYTSTLSQPCLDIVYRLYLATSILPPRHGGCWQALLEICDG
ncbi:hypothetical protein KM043_008306 [Ampulex compressa]|nr:hypothetical protein KM043_008306 [Ampulex compressa]